MRPDGLTVMAFRTGTPYSGEDLVFDASAPERFLARCTRGTPAAPGTCLFERFIGKADVTVRFKRDWLDQWRSTLDNIERMIGELQPVER